MNQYSESEEKSSATAFACFFSLQGTLEDRECFAGLCHLIGTLVHIHWHSCAISVAQSCHPMGKTLPFIILYVSIEVFVISYATAVEDVQYYLLFVRRQ